MVKLGFKPTTTEFRSDTLKPTMPSSCEYDSQSQPILSSCSKFILCWLFGFHSGHCQHQSHYDFFFLVWAPRAPQRRKCRGDAVDQSHYDGQIQLKCCSPLLLLIISFTVKTSCLWFLISFLSIFY